MTCLPGRSELMRVPSVRMANACSLCYLSSVIARPKRLFRYFDPAASDIFAQGKLWFSAAKEFNDIFEFVPRYDQLVNSQVEHAVSMEFAFSFMKPGPQLGWREFKRVLAPAAQMVLTENLEVLPEAAQRKFSEHFGITCFCENGESVLMWGHYTRCHQGFVVEFNPSHPMFDPKELGKIEYSVSRPFADEKDYRKLLLTKSVEWAYEEEHRLIKPFHQLALGKRRDGKEKHFMPLPVEAVSAVYFGFRMQDSTRDELLKSLAVPSAKHIKAHVMRLHRTDYKVVPILWDEWKAPPPEASVDFDGLWKGAGL